MPLHSGYHEPDVKGNVAQVLVPGGDGRLRTQRIFWAECSCGFRGPTRGRYYDADDDCVEHRKAENK